MTHTKCHLDTPWRHQRCPETMVNISRLLYSGNPLNCDCQTKWLRNWVSSKTPATAPRDWEEEPRCYFPKSLSGNPLRQLRSSRFVCNPREATFVSDACNAMPLKTPAQIHMHAVTDTGELAWQSDRIRRGVTGQQLSLKQYNDDLHSSSFIIMS